MEAEQSAGVEGSEAQQQETAMEIEVVSKAETPVEAAEPEKTPAADESEQSAVNGHTEVGETVATEKAEKKPKEDPEIELEKGMSELSVKADLVAADCKETEKNQPEQGPVQEKPLAAQTDETLPEPATAQQLVEAQPPKEEEKVAEKIEAKAELKSTKDEVGEVKPAEIVLVSQDKKTEESKGDESGNVQTTEEVKEPEKSEAEATITAAAVEVNASEPKEADAKPEEDPTPEVGSLAFHILDEKAKAVLQTTRTLVVLRGLPGSGKSFLARAIAAAYEDHCSVISADDHGVKPESPDSSADGYKALDEAVVARCSTTSHPPLPPILVVVDDTNHTQDRLARLRTIAKAHQLVVIFLEPRTEWSRDAAQLAKKSKRGLEQSKIEAMKASFDETSLPLFFGWFLFSTVQDKVRCTAMDFLKTLDTMEAFKKHLSDFTGKEEKEVDLEQYFKAKGTLHCTTKFTNYGKAEGAKEYAEKQAVKDLYSSFTDLSLSALFVTPRTVGARVSLNEEQLLLWPDDAEKEAESDVPAAASLPRGSRGHITLGCAEGVQPVQTGYDLLDILALQKDGKQGEEVEEMEPGTLTYFGEGRWYLALREPICAPACFSSVYKSKAPGQAKKEKKKPKCSIL